MNATTEPKLRWPQRLAMRLAHLPILPAALLCWLTKERKIGGRMDVWVGIALLAGGMVVFKSLPYIDRQAGTDIAGNVAAIVPILIAGSLTGLLAWVICKNNFLTLSADAEQELLDAAHANWLTFAKYIASTLLDRGTFLILWAAMFAAAVGK